MAQTKDVERLKRRIPAISDELARDLTDDAERFIKAYTGRRDVPDGLRHVITQLAVIYYNRQGIEGETSHGEGVSRSMELLPDDIKRQLLPYRVARVGSVNPYETCHC